MHVLLAGASGYIGQSVLQQLLTEGHQVTALLRPGTCERFVREHPGDGYQAVACDLLADPEWFRDLEPVDAAVSCLASRGGGIRDAVDVEYSANTSLLRGAKQLGAGRFLLLSAICVQKPKLEFQRQKLRFEEALMESGTNYKIVRPTAYFKSLAGQIKRIKENKPFLVFGDGQLTACKPISVRDLASFMTRALSDERAANSILPIGGPGPAITPLDQARLLFAAFKKPVRIKSVSPAIFDVATGVLDPFSGLSRWCRDKAEFARIGRYYATESMLVWNEAEQSYRADETPETGSDTLADFYEDVASGRKQALIPSEQKLF